MKKYPSYCCQSCGALIGWLAKFLWPWTHKCPPPTDSPPRP